jgi:hypothetical protein
MRVACNRSYAEVQRRTIERVWDHCLSLLGSAGRCRFLSQGMNDKADDRDANTGIRHVEGRPGLGEADVQVKEKKVDDITVGEAIGQVAEDTGEEQSEGQITPAIFVDLFPQEQGNDRNESDAWEHDEKRVVVSKGTESCARVRDIYQIEPAGDDDLIRFRIDVTENPILADLIESIKRQRKKKHPLHIVIRREAEECF